MTLSSCTTEKKIAYLYKLSGGTSSAKAIYGSSTLLSFTKNKNYDLEIMILPVEHSRYLQQKISYPSFNEPYPELQPVRIRVYNHSYHKIDFDPHRIYIYDETQKRNIMQILPEDFIRNHRGITTKYLPYLFAYQWRRANLFYQKIPDWHYLQSSDTSSHIERESALKDEINRYRLYHQTRTTIEQGEELVGYALFPLFTPDHNLILRTDEDVKKKSSVYFEPIRFSVTLSSGEAKVFAAEDYTSLDKSYRFASDDESRITNNERRLVEEAKTLLEEHKQIHEHDRLKNPSP